MPLHKFYSFEKIINNIFFCKNSTKLVDIPISNIISWDANIDAKNHTPATSKP